MEIRADGLTHVVRLGIGPSGVIMNNPPGVELPLDPHWLVYGIGLTLVTGLSFGLGPALTATKTDLARALRSEGMSGTPSSPRQRIWAPRNLLVIVLLAVSLMLLIAAGLAVRFAERRFTSNLDSTPRT